MTVLITSRRDRKGNAFSLGHLNPIFTQFNFKNPHSLESLSIVQLPQIKALKPIKYNRFIFKPIPVVGLEEN